MSVNLRIAKALFPPEEWDLTDAKAAVLDDWEREEGDSLSMSKEDFFDSLFETVDIWCDAIGEKPYVEFLDMLFRQITTLEDGVFSWCEMHKIISTDGKQKVSTLVANDANISCLPGLVF